MHLFLVASCYNPQRFNSTIQLPSGVYSGSDLSLSLSLCQVRLTNGGSLLGSLLRRPRHATIDNSIFRPCDTWYELKAYKGYRLNYVPPFLNLHAPFGQSRDVHPDQFLPKLVSSLLGRGWRPSTPSKGGQQRT